eukprot:g8046.t1
MKKSDDAYHSVREDLLHYMEGVRARMSEDGTPSVTFPRNFDRIVGLMGRSELEDQAPPEELKVTDNNESGKMQRNQEDRGKERGKGQGRRKPQGDLLPPWTKYLLEEGLDRTKAFSRYRGMFADEQTGEDRVMRGLAKMRELDLRLARTTERARELKIMAHQAAEQAERAAARVETDSKRTSPRHPKGRGPVAVEDVTSNNPRLRLPLPLSSGTSPFGAISSRVSNGSARQMGSGGGGGTGLGTQRSEMSEASGSQAGADGTGSSNRDGQARGGRAFVTQKLAEINAKLLAIGGVNVHVLADRDEEQEDDNAVQGKTSPPPPPPPPSRSHVTTGPPPGARGDPAPGEAALREQRERREARCKERAIDNALEQLRDSLFQTSTADGRNLREEAVDTALELARSAPLDMQGGIRQGAGRIESLLGGDGPQPVGEWEVKHALRLGEEELQGKDLASREKIEELLVTVRQQSAADSRCASLLQRRVSTSDDFPQGTTLDAAFSLTGAARSDAEDGSADIPASCASPVDSSSSPSSAKGGGPMDAAETALKQPQKADGNILVTSLLVLICAVVAVVGKKKQEALNRDTTPFWLRDTLDGMCLGPDGFGFCDAKSLWILAYTHPTKKTKAIVSMLAPEAERMCLGSSSGGWFSSLRPVGVSKCAKGNAKNLELSDLSVQGHSGFLLVQGKNCLARGQGALRNSADMQLCTKGTPLEIVETPVHTAGTQIATADGYCFDGARFRVCNDGDPMLRWGVGLDFRSKEPSRNLFYFFDREKCAVREGSRARKGECKDKGAGKWGWKDGKLTQGGSHCLGRKSDNTAVMVPCSEGYEHVSFETPDIVPITTHHQFEERETASARRGGGGSRRFDL